MFGVIMFGAIALATFPELRLTAAEILTVVE
jgi:hypothetical protein